MTDKPAGVRVAPTVLIDIAREAALAVPGVARLATLPRVGVGRLFGRVHAQEGVRLRLADDGVAIDIHVVVSADASMPSVAGEVQRDVARSIHDLAGVKLQRLDVIVEDVSFGTRSTLEQTAERS
jgi:uncharacterized alkaline shock family protein YloU